jgi:predicted ATP-dependent protease
MSKKFELKAADLRYVCDPKVFKFKNTSEIKPLYEVIGQKRAVQAIEFGLNMKSSGYNIFVTGVEGTGKSTIVRDLVSKHARTLPKPDDWCLVNNFKDHFRPQAIAVPSGKAVPFSKKMHKFVEDLKKQLPKAFEGEGYLKRLSGIKSRFSDKQNRLFQKIDRFATRNNLQILKSEEAIETVPVIDGTPLTPEDYNKLPHDRKAVIEANIRRVQEQIELASVEIDKLNQALHVDVEKLMDEVTLAVVASRLEKIRSEFKDSTSILKHLDEIEQDIVENVHFFMPEEEGSTKEEAFFKLPLKSKLHRYQVNALTNREPAKGAPVIFETNPTYHNVMGRIEKRAYMGTVTTDFTMIKAGSLLNANGGILIMDMESLMMHPYVWEALKRALRDKFLQIEDIAEESGKILPRNPVLERFPCDRHLFRLKSKLCCWAAMTILKCFKIMTIDLTKYLKSEQILIMRWREMQTRFSNMPALLPGSVMKKNFCRLRPKAWQRLWNTAKNTYPIRINCRFALAPCWGF